MNDQLDVMRLLTDARPTYFNQPADPHRQQADLRRIMAQPSSTVEQPTPPNADPRRLSSGTRSGAVQLFRPTRPGMRRRLIGTSVAAGVAAVTLTVVGAVAGPQSAGRSSTGPAPAVDVSHSHVLLLAAEHVGAATDNGRYWRTTTETRDLELGSAHGGTFRLIYRGVDETWVGRTTAITSWEVTHPWSRVPASSRDRSNWQRAGSPATFDLNDLNRAGHLVTVIPGVGARGGKNVVDPFNPESEVFSIGGLDKSMSDIRRLPAEPNALTTVLLENYQRSVDAAVRSGRNQAGTTGTTKQAWLFGTAAELLTLPVTPPVRATAYRIIAGLDGVVTIGRTRDVTGRTGDSVAFRSDSSHGLQEDRLVIDPTTGMLLAEEIRLLRPVPAMSWVQPTDIYRTSIVTRIGWTDDKPPARTKYVPSGKGLG